MTRWRCEVSSAVAPAGRRGPMPLDDADRPGRDLRDRGGVPHLQQRGHACRVCSTSPTRGLATRFPDAPRRPHRRRRGSSDGTRGPASRPRACPAVVTTHEAPLGERVAVPFHGVPGRGAALRGALGTAHRLGARVRPAPRGRSRLARARLDRAARDAGAGTRRPTSSRPPTRGIASTAPSRTCSSRRSCARSTAAACTSRSAASRRSRRGSSSTCCCIPSGTGAGATLADVWILGTAIADGFSVWEAWLGPRVDPLAHADDRPADDGGADARRRLHGDGSARRPVARGAGQRAAARGRRRRRCPGIEPRDGRRRAHARAPSASALRDLTPIWEHILAPDTLGDVLALESQTADAFRFPDDLWARVVYDFALGHHYGVVHREHLLRSLVPLYLGRTAAFVVATRRSQRHRERGGRRGRRRARSSDRSPTSWSDGREPAQAGRRRALEGEGAHAEGGHPGDATDGHHRERGAGRGRRALPRQARGRRAGRGVRGHLQGRPRRPRGLRALPPRRRDASWREAPMRFVDNDRWAGDDRPRPDRALGVHDRGAGRCRSGPGSPTS